MNVGVTLMAGSRSAVRRLVLPRPLLATRPQQQEQQCRLQATSWPGQPDLGPQLGPAVGSVTAAGLTQGVGSEGGVAGGGGSCRRVGLHRLQQGYKCCSLGFSGFTLSCSIVGFLIVHAMALVALWKVALWDNILT